MDRFDPAWSLRPQALELVEKLVGEGRTVVVECGSGLSTVTIARALRDLATGHVHSLEHDGHWAATTRHALAEDGLAEYATVVEAALVDGWYDRGSLHRLPERGIELLLVDGPPAGEPRTERRRYPALPSLAARLAPGAAVLLDDTDRAGERWVLDRWLDEFPIRLDPAPPGTALARYIPAGFQGSNPDES
jgi:predicted O-methyltransferase YrrM